MKTILQIIVILLVAAIVAGGYALIVKNTSIASGTGGEGGQPPAMTTGEMPVRPKGMPAGDHEGGASIGQGLLQVLVTLAKLTGITAIVLLVEKVAGAIVRRKPQTI